MSLYKNIPGEDTLKNLAGTLSLDPVKVNGHFHTPYSFSAFSDMNKVFEMAAAEDIRVLGINDFYTMDGYQEFASLCLENRKFPLFNIEFMGLLKQEQEHGIRVNDPNNPGRTYLSGKGLDFPVSLEGELLGMLESVRKESDVQTREMVEKASAHLAGIDKDLKLDYNYILDNFTRGMVRERHIAQVVRTMVFQKYHSGEERKQILSEIYGGRESKADPEDSVAVDGEIRSMLLKSGGVAFVPEDPKAFLEIEDVIRIIRGAGGIPCYPVLLDDSKGNFTDFESDPEKLYNRLTSLNIWSLELIPGRNSLAHLKPFVNYFNDRDFVITFGTEHNTPALDPLTVSAGDGELDQELLEIGYQGACVIAAHQYLRSKGEQGYIEDSGKPADRKSFVKLGNAVIKSFLT